MNTILKTIKASFAMFRFPDANLVQRLNAIYEGILSHSADFPNPPVTPEVFKAAIDKFDALSVQALGGGVQITLQKNTQRAVVLKMTEQLAHHVEANCKDDMATFTSSGFLAVSRTRTAPQPLPQPVIDSLNQGPSGQMEVTPTFAPKTLATDVSCIAVGSPPNSEKVVTTTSPKPVTITGLTPGTIYTFRVRALGKAGHTEWSEPINRMCI